jgi:hypothetical protein
MPSVLGLDRCSTIIAKVQGIGKYWMVHASALRKGHMSELGRLLVLLGIVIVAAGLALILLGRMHVPVGRLPGNFLYRGKNTTVYFPLATSILLSIVVSVVLYLIRYFRR